MLACQHQLDTNKSYKIHVLSYESIFFFHTEWVNTHFVLKSNLYILHPTVRIEMTSNWYHLSDAKLMSFQYQFNS